MQKLGRVADCSEKTTTTEISKTQARMPTAVTSSKVLCTYLCACAGGCAEGDGGCAEGDRGCAVGGGGRAEGGGGCALCARDAGGRGG